MPRLRRYGRADLPVGLDARQRVPTSRIPNAAGVTGRGAHARGGAMTEI